MKNLAIIMCLGMIVAACATTKPLSKIENEKPVAGGFTKMDSATLFSYAVPIGADKVEIKNLYYRRFIDQDTKQVLSLKKNCTLEGNLTAVKSDLSKMYYREFKTQSKLICPKTKFPSVPGEL